jgi:hypothetical protein
LALQTDSIKYGICRLTNDVIVNSTVRSEVKFYPVKVKLPVSWLCVHIITHLYLRNLVHHIVALIAENALKLTNAYPYFRNFLWTKNPVQ